MGQYDSDYEVRLATLEAMGGDTTKHYHSVYEIDLAILELTEQGGGGGGIPEAPINGNTYARKDGEWEWVVSAPFEDDAPFDNETYGRKNGDWVEIESGGATYIFVPRDSNVGDTIEGIDDILNACIAEYTRSGNINAIFDSKYKFMMTDTDGTVTSTTVAYKLEYDEEYDDYSLIVIFKDLTKVYTFWFSWGGNIGSITVEDIIGDINTALEAIIGG